MSVDTILMIPHLSKELNLIGHPSLPYRLKKSKATKESDKCSNIVFDSKKMTDALVLICFDLMKQVKSLAFNVDDNEIDQISFEKNKLEKQLKICKTDIKKFENALSVEKKMNQLLQEKINELEKLLKEKQAELNKLMKKNLTSENILKHKINKNDSDLVDLHKIIWRKFNLIDLTFFPQNFQVIPKVESDFNKLWSEVKYSDIKTKEEALKKAVCKFQENNRILMEHNYLFQNLFLITLQEINETNTLLQKKLHLPKVFSEISISDVFLKGEGFDVNVYKNTLFEHFNSLKKLFKLFEEASFFVSEDLFVCWTDLVKKFKSSNEDIS